MPATNPSGDQKYWEDGKPYGGLKKEQDSQKHWSDGLPYEYIFPQSTQLFKTRITIVC